MEYSYNNGTPTLTIDLNDETFSLKWFQKCKSPAQNTLVRERFSDIIIEAVSDMIYNEGHLISWAEDVFYNSTAIRKVKLDDAIKDALNLVVDGIVSFLDSIEIPKRGKPAEFTYEIQWS